MLGFLGAFYPWLTHWLELAMVALEVYVLFGFFALLTGLALVKSKEGVFPECLLNNFWTNRQLLNCGSRFTTGSGALNFLFYSIVQFLVIKPIIMLATAVYYQRQHQDFATGIKAILNIISALSIIFATVAVLRLYKGLRVQPNSVLVNHNGLTKILVVKLLFFFVVMNNLILRNMATRNALPVPVAFCDKGVAFNSTDTSNDWCENRTINVILIVESLICILPALISYRPHGLGLTRKIQWTNHGSRREVQDESI